MDQLVVQLHTQEENLGQNANGAFSSDKAPSTEEKNKQILEQKLQEFLVIDKFAKAHFKQTYLGCLSVQTNEHLGVLNQLNQQKAQEGKLLNLQSTTNNERQAVARCMYYNP